MNTRGVLYTVRGPRAVYYALRNEETGRVWTERTELAARDQANELAITIVNEAEITQDELVRLMVGEALSQEGGVQKPHAASAAPVAEPPIRPGRVFPVEAAKPAHAWDEVPPVSVFGLSPSPTGQGGFLTQTFDSDDTIIVGRATRGGPGFADVPTPPAAADLEWPSAAPPANRSDPLVVRYPRGRRNAPPAGAFNVFNDAQRPPGADAGDGLLG